jgi:hypothetical protein
VRAHSSTRANDTEYVGTLSREHEVDISFELCLLIYRGSAGLHLGEEGGHYLHQNYHALDTLAGMKARVLCLLGL